ncbi:MAG TPA: ABC transporter ATP-binding protein [Candidatus Paceibacterota bacterium]|nr:ABC transporter ATP-binding protein [Candidatus Paceibacterota bacterium]HJN62899.1 ABC transporter ATP-binding protein [Candidatus Paceibacterota bacterium]
MSLISAKGLEKIYSDGTKALRGVDLEIEEGEFIAIMGPSGSGKSTLLHILGFLDRPTKGNLKFSQTSQDDYSELDLAKIRNSEMGFVFQMFNLLPRASVLENVKLPLTYREIIEPRKTEIAKLAIKSVDLTYRIENLSNELSGGEKQRVAIARALVNNPKIIFADEPTGNLDSKTGKVIMEILRRLNEEEKKTIILITHEARTASHAKRVIKMLDGKIEEDVFIGRNNYKDKYLK